jgi:hypothetical protein
VGLGSEGDALGYYGAGLWPACPKVMTEASSGHFNREEEKTLVRHYPYFLERRWRMENKR